MKIFTLISHGIRYVKRYIYGFFVGLQFSHRGKKSYIKSPCTIIGGENITVGDFFACGNGCRIEAWSKYKGESFSPKICIGNNVRLGNNCHIGAIGKVKIDHNVLMGSNIFITDHFHGNTSLDDLRKPPLERSLFHKGEVHIEECVWIGDSVSIMPGVTIGKNSVVGANSVVTKNIPAYSVAVGNPARVIKSYWDEMNTDEKCRDNVTL